MLALCEFLNQLGIKGWQVIGSTGRHQALITVDFLIYPRSACIAQVGLQGGEGRQRTALKSFSISQDPGTVADGTKREILAHVIAHNFYCGLVQAQQVGIAGTAGQNDAIERLASGCLLYTSPSPRD